MSKARLIITAVVVEGRSPSEVARTYGVARSWVYVLVDRYRAEGDAAFEPRSRVSLRINGQMHHIGLGRTLDGTRVIMLIDHPNIRIIHATTGEIIHVDGGYHAIGA